MSGSSHSGDSILKELMSGDDTRAEAALGSISDSTEELIPELFLLARSDDPGQRWWATAALARIGGAAVITALINALQDPDPAVRQCAALGLARLPDSRAIPDLVQALGDPDRLCARLASAALAEHGEAAVSALAEALRAEDPGIRIEAARALAHIDHASIVPLLFSALDDPSPLVALFAEQGLERQNVGMVFFRP